MITIKEGVCVISITLALFKRDGDEESTPVSLQCEIEGYTRISEWRKVIFHGRDKSEIDTLFI